MNPAASLESLYARLRESTKLSEPIEERMSPPLLIAPRDKWSESKDRILVVGQETLGWKQTDAGINSFLDFRMVPGSVYALQNAYIEFCFSKGRKKHWNSPFWRAYRKIREAFDTPGDGIATNVLWTNLYRCSNDGKSWYGRSGKRHRETVEKALDGILLQEIDILSPTGIVFFTGPQYDGYLKTSLNGEFETSPVDSRFSLRQLAKVYINKTSIPAFRTYHPNYLQRAKKDRLWDVIDTIVDTIRETNGA